jgi:hypothetical protein
MEKEPQDRDPRNIDPQILRAEKEKGIAGVAECKKDNDEEKIFKLLIPSAPV